MMSTTECGCQGFETGRRISSPGCEGAISAGAKLKAEHTLSWESSDIKVNHLRELPLSRLPAIQC